jgi:hypothetical protein
LRPYSAERMPYGQSRGISTGGAIKYFERQSRGISRIAAKIW